MRMIYDSSVQKFIKVLIITGLLVLLLPIVTITIGNLTVNKSNNVSKFNMNEEDIILKNNGEEIKVKVHITKEDKIVEMNLEEYVRGVVAGEMPAAFELEAIKAQAVAARTYALSRIKSVGGKPCDEAKGADLCDTVHCQVYMSKEERFEGWPEKSREDYWGKLTEAVRATSGEIITFNGEVITQPLYFAVSAGKTEEAAQVFSNSVPYLKSVESPGEEIAPKYKSTVKISNSELLNTINKAYPKAKITLSNIKNQIIILNRNSGGTVNQLRIGNETIKGTAFRELFSLNSANFSFNFLSNSLEITCFGYGHNVGMSQWGANVMAKEGKKYIEILTHYYKDTDVEKIDNSIAYNATVFSK